MTFRVQPAVITRICDGCRTESDPVDLPVLREQGWTLAPGGPYDHPVPALDWCPNCTNVPKGTLRRLEQAEAVIARVRDVCDRIWDDARYAHKYGFLKVVREVRYALEGDSDE